VIGQSVDNVVVRAQIALVLVPPSLVPLVSNALGTASRGAGLTWTLQQATLEVVEGTTSWRVVGVEAAEERVEAVITHHSDPDGEAGHRGGASRRARSGHSACARRAVVS
jgi:hypothetical protein